MDIIGRLEAKDIQKQNIERGDPIFKDAIAEIESLRAQLAAQPTPSQSVDERAEFEQWFSDNYLQHYTSIFKLNRFAKNINGKYRWEELQVAFESFKYGASRYSKPQPTSQDAERLDFIARKFTGLSDSERYLPFRLYWGKGQAKSLRELIDNAMKEGKT